MPVLRWVSCQLALASWLGDCNCCAGQSAVRAQASHCHSVCVRHLQPSVVPQGQGCLDSDPPHECHPSPIHLPLPPFQCDAVPLLRHCDRGSVLFKGWATCANSTFCWQGMLDTCGHA